MEIFLIWGWGIYAPRGALALYTNTSQSSIGWCGWGFHTVRGGVDPGKLRFRPRVVGVAHVWKDFDPGIVPYPPRGALALCTSRNQSAIGQWGWCFHTVRGSFDPGDHRFRPQVVGFVKS